MVASSDRPERRGEVDSSRIAVVTGGGGGIGRAIALRLAREDCDVGILDRDASVAEAIVARVQEAGRRATFVTAGVSDNKAFVINPAMYKQLPFDVRKDFVPCAMVSSIPMLVVVHPSVPARSIRDLADVARQEPGRLTYGTPGAGTPQHLATELLASRLAL